jgi:hypothetical protein
VGNVTITSGATAVINCYGSWTSAATGVVFTTTLGAQINFLATTTGKTITTNNVTMGSMVITLNGVGGEWSLGSAFTCTDSFNINAGTFTTTASNYAFTVGRLVSSSGTVRSISLNASTITITAATAVNFTLVTNLTLNAGTSAITCTSTSAGFTGGGQTFYNVSFTSNATGTTNIQGANTFNNLSQTSRSATGVRSVIFGASQTINGTLTLGAANTSIRRILVYAISAVGIGIGTPITLTVATIATLADVNFRDIVAAGASGTWSGTRLSNGGGNSNITFAAGVNKYWNLAAGGVWSATAWALTSGGAVDTNNLPLAQDTVIIEDTGLTASNTITIDTNWWLPTINASTRTTAFTLASGTQTPIIFGDFNIPSVTTITGTGIWYFGAINSTQNITTNNVSLTFPITIIGSTTNTVKLLDNLTLTNTVTLTQGTLDLNNNTLTILLQFNSTNTGVRTIAFGATGKIVLTGTTGSVLSMSIATNFTYTGTSRIEITASGAGRTITPTAIDAVESNVLNIYVNTGSDTVTVSGSARFLNFDLTGFSGTLTYASNARFFGDLVFSSAMTLGSIGSTGFIFSKTLGTQTITSAGKTIDNGVLIDGVGGTVFFQDALTLGSTRTLTLTNGTLDLNGFTLTTGLFSSSNSNTRVLAFGTGKIVLTGTAATLFATGVATNLTVTGTNPLIQLTTNATTGTRGITMGAAGEANAISVDVTAGSDTIGFGTTSGSYKNVNFTGFTGTYGASNSIAVFGNWNYGGVTSLTGTGTINFSATSGTKTITSNGVAFPGSVAINGVGGTFSLQDALTLASTEACIFTNGTLDLNGFTLTTGVFSSNNSNVRTLAFGTGKIVLTGTNAIIYNTTTATGFTMTGTKTVEVTGVGVGGETRVISGPSTGGGGVAANAANFYIQAGADIISLGTANRVYGTLNFTGFSGSTLGDVAPQIYGDLVLSSTMTVAGGTNFWGFLATTSQTITTNGVTINNPITFNGIGGTFVMQDALTLGSTRTLTMTNGTLKLKSGTTSTVGAFVTSGTNQKFLSATTSGTQATISDASGTNSVDYLTIQDSNATGGALFQAFTSNFNVDAGNNTGWKFSNNGGTFLVFF